MRARPEAVRQGLAGRGTLSRPLHFPYDNAGSLRAQRPRAISLWVVGREGLRGKGGITVVESQCPKCPTGSRKVGVRAARLCLDGDRAYCIV